MSDEANVEKQKALAQTQLTDLQDTIAHLRAKNTQLEKWSHSLQETRGAEKELAKEVASAVRAVEPYPRRAIKQGNECAVPIGAILKLSDWHIGQKTNPAETEGFGAYNWEIAQARLDKLAEKIVGWAFTHRRSFKIPILDIFCEGDDISGDIHYELQVTNEFPLPVQTANAGHARANFISRLAPHFDHIRVTEVGADNHGRLRGKPQFKQKTQNNMTYLVNVICNAALSRHSNVETIQAEGMKYLQTVSNHKFLIEHGDNVKAFSGTPYYGMNRLLGKEAIRRMGTGREFDYWSIAHWHIAAIIDGMTLVNGSLSGTDEYDHGFGRHGEPSQVSFLMHPRHGLFDWTPWTFARPKEDTNGENKRGASR
jgi:hypothetical protein